MPAQYVLGKLYYKGEVIGKDCGKALSYLEKAAEAFPNAAYLAGKICLADDEQKDIGKAIRYFETAAKAGNGYAEYELGKLYLFGKEVPRSESLAIEYLNSSAEKGNIYAQQLLRYMESERRYYSAVNAVWLLGHIAKILQSSIEGEYGGLSRIDKKQRREIMQKKQAQGMK